MFGNKTYLRVKFFKINFLIDSYVEFGDKFNDSDRRFCIFESGGNSGSKLSVLLAQSILFHQKTKLFNVAAAPPKINPRSNITVIFLIKDGQSKGRQSVVKA